jgi:hypothetical protein
MMNWKKLEGNDDAVIEKLCRNLPRGTMEIHGNSQSWQSIAG